MTPQQELGPIVEELLGRVAQVTWEHLDGSTQDATLRAVFDSLGIASGGAIAPGVAPTLEVLAATAGQADIPVPWVDLQLPVCDAAMALSLLIHAWDFDDTHDAAVVHACTASLPAAYAAAVARGASGTRLLEGVVAGVETILRLSLLLGPQHGVIRTAGLGAYGAAAAAGRVLGLSPDGLQAAMSLATPISMSPTTRQVIDDGAITKRHQPGFAVRHGVLAAFLAEQGLTGSSGWFTGTYGLGGLTDGSEAARERASRPGWEIARLSLKPYPACRYTHAAVAATERVLYDVAAADVVRAEVHVPSGVAHELVARPWERRGIPIIDAQFSIPWLVGAVLETGRVDLEVISGPSLLDPAVEARARQVELLQDEQEDVSGMTPVEVVLHGADGELGRARITDCPGSPTSPLGWEVLAGKAAGCARAAGQDEHAVQELEAWVRAPPTSDGVLADAPFVVGDRAHTSH